MNRFISKWWKEIDKTNFLIIISIIIIGVILSFSIEKGFTFFNRHLIYASIALIIMISISCFEIKLLRRLSLLGLILFTIFRNSY